MTIQQARLQRPNIILEFWQVKVLLISCIKGISDLKLTKQWIVNVEIALCKAKANDIHLLQKYYCP